MRKKRPTWDQSTLFPITPDDSRESPHSVTATLDGDTDAVQDNSPGTSEGEAGVVQTTASDAQAPSDAGDLRDGTEGQPRDLEGDIGAGEAEQRTQPDRQRSSGNGNQGTGGSFTARVSSGRGGTVVTRQGKGFRPKSYVERLRAFRGQRSLFDPQSEYPATDMRAAPEPPQTAPETTAT